MSFKQTFIGGFNHCISEMDPCLIVNVCCSAGGIGIIIVKRVGFHPQLEAIEMDVWVSL